MTTQPDLFQTVGAPYRRDSETSREAALEITPKVNALELDVLRVLADWSPLSIDSIGVRAKMKTGTVRPRVSILKKKGLVEKVAKARGISVEGKPQSVVRITAKGREYLRKNAVDSIHAANGGSPPAVSHATRRTA